MLLTKGRNFAIVLAITILLTLTIILMAKKQSSKTGFVGSLFPDLDDSNVPQAPKGRNKKTLSEKLADKEDELFQLQQKYSDLKDEKAQLQSQNEQLTAQIAKLKQKADAFDELLASESLFPTNIVAKSFGWSAIKLNQYLHEQGIQYKHGDVWVLYQKYANKGYTREMWYNYGKNSIGKDLTRAHTYWTMKGIVFIRELLKKNGQITD